MHMRLSLLAHVRYQDNEDLRPLENAKATSRYHHCTALVAAGHIEASSCIDLQREM